jgi:hypothetical protein
MIADLAQVLYPLAAQNSAFWRMRSEPCVALFRRLIESEDEKLTQLAYLIFTSLGLRDMVAPAVLARDLATAALEGSVLRYLTVANLRPLDPLVVDLVFSAREQKLAVAALWRFATHAPFVAPILAHSDAIAALDPRDALKLLVIMMAVVENRAAVSELPCLPQLLTRLAETGDVQILQIVRRFVRRLPLTVAIVQALEQAGFIRAYIEQAVSSAAPELLKECCYVLDAIVHVTHSPSAAGFLTAIAEKLAVDPSLQKYALPLLVGFSYFPQNDEQIKALGFAEILMRLNVVPENHELVGQVHTNVSVEQPTE